MLTECRRMPTMEGRRFSSGIVRAARPLIARLERWGAILVTGSDLGGSCLVVLDDEGSCRPPEVAWHGAPSTTSWSRTCGDAAAPVDCQGLLADARLMLPARGLSAGTANDGICCVLQQSSVVVEDSPRPIVRLHGMIHSSFARSRNGGKKAV